ncbi:accessory Sec system protein Asp1 [Leuconostoc suionicum]|uniref:accessory Sec system protein Asp1 n=1 Tax=Leuconostoc suionicum TaxID=1511761 RepID=UPI00233EBCE3|nr:accessory Sec system protein Asp1 [Leuconostoc suionicum]MDC2806334.1 accessory Sec system protein Asp1 [Leuconostoc suionicum]MDC2823846.1 accessory Sec system protein Asp1 [Leuconostoc suionicum]
MRIHIMPNWSELGVEIPQFNDSIHQAQLFLEQGQEVAFILCDYLPKLRGILSNKNIEKASVWSAFDVLQHIDLSAPRPVALNDFTWPAYAEFMTLTDRILVNVSGQHYATIWSNQLSFDHIDLFADDMMTQQLIIDDRGFVSKVIVFDEGNKVRTDYLTPSGDIALQEDELTGLVTTQQLWTEQTQFSNMTVLIHELLSYYLNKIPDDENIIISPSVTTGEILEDIAIKQPVIVSVQNSFVEVGKKLEKISDFIVTDNERRQQQVIAFDGETKEVAIVPPYATDMLENEHPQSPLVSLFISAHNLSVAQQTIVIAALINIINEYDTTTVVFETSDKISAMQKQIHEASLKAKNEHGLVDQDSQMAFKSRFHFLETQNEEQLLRYMKNTRILIDLDNEPNQFLQTLAINFSIPQINSTETVYLKPDKNGKVLADFAELDQAISFFLDSKKHFEIAQEVSADIQAEYTSEMLWIKWQQVFNKIKSKMIS